MIRARKYSKSISQVQWQGETGVEGRIAVLACLQTRNRRLIDPRSTRHLGQCQLLPLAFLLEPSHGLMKFEQLGEFNEFLMSAFGEQLLWRRPFALVAFPVGTQTSRFLRRPLDLAVQMMSLHDFSLPGGGTSYAVTG